MQTETTLDLARYPIGKFTPPPAHTPELRAKSLKTLAGFPDKLRTLTAQADEKVLESTYRPGSWTMRQIVHHCADSHMNGYTRFRLALTEENPSIKLYHQEDWAALDDARTAPPELSIALLESLHARWVLLLDSLTEQEWNRTFYRADRDRTVPLWEAAAHYAWHCEHHLGHVSACLGTANS